jgi:O-antigen ligase
MQTKTMQSRVTPRRPAYITLVGFIALLGGVWGWWVAPPATSPTLIPSPAAALTPGTVAPMTGPAFVYSPGWQVTDLGADPAEPADPWLEPSGVLTFTYRGQDLWLQLAPGDYWGYLYVTVDGIPANRLAVIPGNRNALGERAGYQTLYAPERQGADGLSADPVWIWAHHAARPTGEHTVQIELWRSWGQTPLRGVAVDPPLPAQLPRAPFVALAVVGVALLATSSLALNPARFARWRTRPAAFLTRLTGAVAPPQRHLPLALVAGLLIAAAVISRIWWLGPIGLALLGYVALRRPALWATALLFALPFYFSQTLPILPQRATNLIDIGVLGGVVVVMGNLLIVGHTQRLRRFPTLVWMALLAGWALIATAAAPQEAVALREWRTLFLAAYLFALLLAVCRADRQAPWLLVGGWLAGALVIAAIGLAQFLTNVSLIEAEGVRRVLSLYGSPNNLALYLERSLMPALALLLLLPNRDRGRDWRIAAGLAAAVIGVALLLTFSKGALILGLPAGLFTLWLGGLFILRRQGASTRPLWWLAAAAGAALLLMLPFLATERFQRLFDLNSGTGFTRLQLWRSAWQMALDHPLLGVGPDNFLYSYRSRYLLPAAWQEPNLNHPHTWLLDWWTRLGVVGMLIGLGWWATGIVALGQRLAAGAAGDRAQAALWLGLLAAAMAALSHGLIDLSYAVPDLMLIWVLITALPAFTLGLDPPPRKSAEAAAPAD